MQVSAIDESFLASTELVAQAFWLYGDAPRSRRGRPARGVANVEALVADLPRVADDCPLDDDAPAPIFQPFQPAGNTSEDGVSLELAATFHRDSSADANRYLGETATAAEIQRLLDLSVQSTPGFRAKAADKVSKATSELASQSYQ